MAELTSSAYSFYQQNGIRIGFVQTEPYVYPCGRKYKGTQLENKTLCSYPGEAIEISLLICRYLQIACTFVHYKYSDFGKLDNNGNWSGLLGHLLKREIDATGPYFNPTENRIRSFDFSQAAVVQRNCLISKAPAIENFTSTAVFDVFHWSVWILIMVSTLVSGFVLTLTGARKATPTLTDHFTSFKNHCFHAVGLLSNQSSTPQLNRASSYMALGFWSITCLFLCGHYSGRIVGVAMVTTMNKHYHNLEDFTKCVERGHCVLATPTTSLSYYERIYQAKRGVYLKIKEAIARNPVQVYPGQSYVKILEDTLLFSKVYTVFNNNADFASLLKNAKQPCAFYATVIPDFEAEGFAVQKGSKLNKVIDIALFALADGGHIDRIYRKYIGNYISMHESCFKTLQKESQSIPFNAFAGGVALLGAGLALGLVVLTTELVFSTTLKYRTLAK